MFQVALPKMGRGDLAKMAVFRIIGQCRGAVKNSGIVESNCRMVPTFISQPSLRLGADLSHEGCFGRRCKPIVAESGERLDIREFFPELFSAGSALRRCKVAGADGGQLALAFLMSRMDNIKQFSSSLPSKAK
jgi:hypothetical protein